MAFVIKDRVKETSTTTGTGTLTLAGAVTGFQAFSAIGNSNTTGYAIIAVDANGVPTGEWETGIGTYTSAGTTLSRGLIASSTGSLVNFAAGTKHVICCDIAGYMTPLVMATTANRAIQVADQTALSATSGNARGSGAVDLQIGRNAATQVASGAQATIGGGRRNTASGSNTTIAGGQSNTANNTYNTVGGGGSNQATGNNSSTVGGGFNNNCSGSYSTIAGGYNNTASAIRTTIGGGQSNTASGDSGTVVGGRGNTASGALGSTVIGGKYNTASGSYTVAHGLRSKADKYGQISHAAGRFATDGDVQNSRLHVRNSTTNATQTELFTDGSAARITIASDTSWAFEALIVARRTDADNESAAYKITGCIDNNAGTTALVGAITVTVIAEDTAAWDVTAEADNTNDALVFKVTGEAAKTIRWSGKVELSEVSG